MRRRLACIERQTTYSSQYPSYLNFILSLSPIPQLRTRNPERQPRTHHLRSRWRPYQVDMDRGGWSQLMGKMGHAMMCVLPRTVRLVCYRLLNRPSTSRQLSSRCCLKATTKI